MSKSAAPAAQERVTAAHIRAGLKKLFPHPTCGIVFEVAQSTGHAAHRHLDAVAMDTWPSRGLIISGIEIKVDRADFRREIANPAKAEQIARFCDKFFIAAPPGLIKPEDLPHAWGLLEGGAEGMRIKKAAEKTTAQPVTREFLAAIFRASGRGLAADEVELVLARDRARLQAEHTDKVKAEAERLSTNNSEDAKNWRALMAALEIDKKELGAHIYDWDAKKWVQAVRAVFKSGVMDTHHGLLGLQTTLVAVSERVKTAIEVLNLPVPESHLDGLAYLKKRGGNRK